MRDPERIDQVLSELKAYWKAHPDLRLGQIVGNCVPGRVLVDGEYVPGDAYHLEDEDFIDGLRKLAW